MKSKFFTSKKILLTLGFSSLMLFSATEAAAQNFKFTQKVMKDAPANYSAPQIPENLWVSDYKGSSFVINWEAVSGADNYLLDVFTTDVNNIKSFDENFGGVNSTDGYIDSSNPNYPEGWSIDVSTFGDKDVVFDGKNDKLSMDAAGDFIKTPVVDGYITSVIVDMNVINIPENAYVDEENTSAIIFRLYDDHDVVVREGAISTLLFAEMQRVDLFQDLFSYLPPTITAVEFALEKNQERTMGDLMINSISYSYAPRKDLIKDKNVGNGTSYLVENTDAESIYFFNVMSANGNEISAKSPTVLVDMLVTPEPKIVEQTENSFTVGWNAVPRANYYDVSNYNVLHVDEDSSLAILNDDFNQNTEGSFDNPVNVENPDDYTKTVGWIGNKILAADGMFGADNGTMAGPRPNPGFIQTPVLDLSGNGGKYKVHIKAHGTEGDYLSFYRVGYVVDGKLNIHATQTFPADGLIEETWEMEDGVTDMRISIEPKKMKRFFIDEISITQERKAGETIKLGLNKQYIIDNPSQLSCVFDNLDKGASYGYEMRAMREDDMGNIILSEMTDMQIVVLLPTGIKSEVTDKILMSASEGRLNVILTENAKISIYTTDGKKIAEQECTSGSNSFSLNNNIYIVKIGNTTYKVIIK